MPEMAFYCHTAEFSGGTEFECFPGCNRLAQFLGKQYVLIENFCSILAGELA
jgi:hypothetical protein